MENTEIKEVLLPSALKEIGKQIKSGELLDNKTILYINKLMNDYNHSIKTSKKQKNESI